MSMSFCQIQGPFQTCLPVPLKALYFWALCPLVVIPSQWDPLSSAMQLSMLVCLWVLFSPLTLLYFPWIISSTNLTTITIFWLLFPNL